MKLLLTSSGLSNDILRNKFLELIGKDPQDIKVAFIDTASKVEKDRSYVLEDVKNIESVGIKTIDVIDISEPKINWETILINSDVIWVEGGNTFYLLSELKNSGLINDMKDYIKNKLYVGVSAGSIIAGPSIATAGIEPADPNEVNLVDLSSYNWVSFDISPHTPSSVSLENISKYSKESGRKVYAYDDGTAVLVINDKIEFIGVGYTKIFN